MVQDRNRAGAALLLGVGLVNPVPGVSGLLPGAAGTLYGIDPAVELLLRHRSILLALVGAGLLLAVVRPGVRSPAIRAGATSMASFAVLQAGTAEHVRELTRVAVVDAVALPALGIAWWRTGAWPRTGRHQPGADAARAE